MIEIGGRKIYLGDFHGQWNEDRTNPALLVAGLTYYGYDFSVFQGPGSNHWTESMARTLNVPITFFHGRECMFDWAHITTWDLEGDPPPIDNPNFREVLADMKNRSRMLIVAHPYTPFIPHLEELLDEGLVDAIEIVNGGPRSINHSSEILTWLRDMQHKGKNIPVVGGMDIHGTGGYQRPNVCYSNDYPPRADIGALGFNRTAVLVDEFTPEAVVDAVKNGRSIVDAGGELIGNPDLADELEELGYREAVNKAMERLEKITLIDSSDTDIIAAEMRGFVPSPGEGDKAIIRIMTGEGTCDTYEWRTSDPPVEIKIPHTFDRNLFHLGASVEAPDGLARAFALKVRSPAEIDLFSEVTRDDTARAVFRLINRSAQPMEGVISIKPPGKEGMREEPFGPVEQYASAGANIEEDLPAHPSRAQSFEATLKLSTGIERKVKRNLVFVTVPYLDRDDEAYWAGAPEIDIGYEDQLDEMWSSDWRGRDDCSARVRVAWNEQGLYFRAVVVDDVLHPSPRPDNPMFGDSLQIGINPMNREDLPAFSIYDYFLTRHLQGDYLLLDSVPKIACEGIQPPGKHTRISESLFSTSALSPTETLCRVKLPWHLLIPMQPLAGYEFGLHLILWDNDGDGCKASLSWPKFMERETGSAWYAVNNGTWARMRLHARYA